MTGCATSSASVTTLRSPRPGRLPGVSRLPEVTAPTLVIHGTADPVLPCATAEAMAHEIQDDDFLPIEGILCAPA